MLLICVIYIDNIPFNIYILYNNYNYYVCYSLRFYCDSLVSFLSTVVDQFLNYKLTGCMTALQL